MTKRRINYAGSVHDEREIEAVVDVLRGGPTALRIGRNVRNMEERVAALLGKRRGVMCNSGSSALYLAIEVLDLEPGDEIITAAVTFSTDLAPMLRAQLVPVFVDVTPDTFQIDVDAIEEMIGPRTRAILTPDLIGNAPDWDRIREIADRHGLWVIEDSCDALGLTLRGTPTGTRADISLTSFALSHIITAAGTGGMVCFDDDDLADRALEAAREHAGALPVPLRPIFDETVEQVVSPLRALRKRFHRDRDVRPIALNEHRNGTDIPVHA